MAPFRKSVDTRKILVPAGSAPCTMQFIFTNTYSTLLEKVRLGYKIRVIPPSIEALKLGRERRLKSSLDFLESETSSQRKSLEKLTIRLTELDLEATRLKDEISEKITEFDSVLSREQNLKRVLQTSKESKKISNVVDSNKYLNEF